MVAGFQVPEIPFREVVDKVGAALFWQSGPTALNVGGTGPATVIARLNVVAHCPDCGVKR